MSSLKKKIPAWFTVLFIIGTVISAFILFTFQNDLADHSTSVEALDFEPLQPTFNKLYAVLGFTLLSGLVAVLSMSRVRRSDAAKLTYLNQNQGNNTGKDARAAAGEEEETGDTLKGNIQEQLQAIKKSIGRTQNEQALYNKILSALCQQFEASQAAVYLTKTAEDKRLVELTASYALSMAESQTLAFEFGEGLVGQVAKEGKMLNIDNVPDDYLQIVSGLGSASPSNLLILPLKQEDQVYGVVEIASFKAFSKDDEELAQNAFLLAQKKAPAAKSKKTGPGTAGKEKDA